MQDALLEAVEAALQTVVAGSVDLLPVLVVGAPLRCGHRMTNNTLHTTNNRGNVMSMPSRFDSFF